MAGCISGLSGGDCSPLFFSPLACFSSPGTLYFSLPPSSQVWQRAQLCVKSLVMVRVSPGGRSLGDGAGDCPEPTGQCLEVKVAGGGLRTAVVGGAYSRSHLDPGTVEQKPRCVWKASGGGPTRIVHKQETQLIPREAPSGILSHEVRAWQTVGTLRKYLHTDDFRDCFAPGSRAKRSYVGFTGYFTKRKQIHLSHC